MLNVRTLGHSCSVTCATAEYITNVRKSRPILGLLGAKKKKINKYKKCHKARCHIQSALRHTELHGDSDCNWMVLEVHCGLICILFLSQSFGIISQCITSCSNSAG